jgi:phosphoglucosamine mutase
VSLFGTDGARGEFRPDGELGHINGETFELLANAAATSVIGANPDEKPTFIVGGDTRSSSPELIAAAADGAAAAGAEVWDIGVAPTPLIAWLAKQHKTHAFAVTASHNPDKDAGLKLFEAGGDKSGRETLDEVEDLFWGMVSSGMRNAPGGSVIRRQYLKNNYLGAMVENLGGPGVLDGKLMVVDGANGAAFDMAPRLYRALGAEVITFACDPSQPINENCGAAKLDGLKEFLAERPAITSDRRFLGAFAHDGDADRVMGVDQTGNIVNGNHWMHRLAFGEVGIAGTLYTNSGLRQELKRMGVEFHETENGDTHVTKKLQELNARLCEQRYTRGGEASGHLINLRRLSSGDGLYMAGWLATALAREDETLQDVSSSLRLWPEAKDEVPVGGANAKQIVQSDIVQEAIAALPRGVRSIVRGSGTEPIVRVFAEAEDQSAAEEAVRDLSGLIHDSIAA